MTLQSHQQNAQELGSRGQLRVFLMVLIPVLCLYAPTARWELPYHIDPLTNALTSWYIANEGTPVMTQHSDFVGDSFRGRVGWIVESPRGPVAQYPPGAALVGVPLYLVAGGQLEKVVVSPTNRAHLGTVDFPIPPLWPATLTAVLSTALASSLLALALTSPFGTKWAVISGIVFAVATTAWSVASEMLWSHGPALLFVAFALLAMQRDRLLLSGLFLGAATLTRPHLVVLALAVGLMVGVGRRKVRPAVEIGVGAAVGVSLLLAYNWLIFDRLTVSGGYGDSFTQRLTDTDLLAYAANVAGGLIDPSNGLLIWAPFLIVLLPGLREGWRCAPDWMRGLAIGGLLYVLIQLKANRYSGGEGHFGYRYPLEALMASAPLLVASARYWVWDRPLLRVCLLVGLGLAVVAQGLAATGVI